MSRRGILAFAASVSAAGDSMDESKHRSRRSTRSTAIGSSSMPSPTTPSTCSTPTATSPAGIPAPSASRATRRTKSSASTSPASTPPKTAPSVCRPAPCGPPPTEGRFENEGWRVRKDGTRFWAHVIIDPIRDDDGNLIGFAKVTRDLTERREAALALWRRPRKS